MSFSLTERQFFDGTKTVTRRLGWRFLKPGDRLRAVRKAMGLRKGEHALELGVIEVVQVSRERLNSIRQAEVIREGFAHMTPTDFCRMFAAHMGCEFDATVTRIEFRKVGAADERG